MIDKNIGIDQKYINEDSNEVSEIYQMVLDFKTKEKILNSECKEDSYEVKDSGETPPTVIEEEDSEILPSLYLHESLPVNIKEDTVYINENLHGKYNWIENEEVYLGFGKIVHFSF